MKKYPILLISLAYSANAFADNPTIVDIPNTLDERRLPQQNTLPEIRNENKLPNLNDLNQTITPSTTTDTNSQTDLENQLNHAINTANIAEIQRLLALYEQQVLANERDEILVLFARGQIAKSQQKLNQAIALFREILAKNPDLNPVRIELAILLFRTRQDNAAKDQFDKIVSDTHLPDDIRQLVEIYQKSLQSRATWQFNFMANPLRDNNVNRVSDSPKIENTPFVKGASMLPQKARGVGYAFGATRDFNFKKSHYLHFDNTLRGKSYFNNHDYDDMSNRTSLGYKNKSAKQEFGLIPFFEKQWYGGQPYQQTLGFRTEWQRWLKPNWQLSADWEWGNAKYRQSKVLNGKQNSLSGSLLWRSSPTQFFYVSASHTRQNAAEKYYSYRLNSARVGWGRDWKIGGVSSRVSAGVGKRQYRSNLVLGGVFYFDKPRQDKIYNANITLWKRNWHVFGITPKLSYQFSKQKSNFDSLYSYRTHQVNILFEKTF